MYRALYLYNVEELYYCLSQEASKVRAEHPILAHRYSEHEMIFRWFRHQLRRLCYLVLTQHAVDSEQDSELHNHFFITQPHLERQLRQLIAHSPHLWDMDEGTMRLNDRELVLEYRVETLDHITYLQRRRQWSLSSPPGT